jgi:DNA-binding XRE family transcriptional regulator
MLFHEKLIQRRKERGMTQEELAACLSVSRQTVSKWENGECMPDADKFIRLSDILEISLDELAGREVEVAPIVLPAPEVPQPKKKPFRWMVAAAVCLVIGAGCFAAGRYVFPKQAPALVPTETQQAVSALPETQESASALPETLTVTNFGLVEGRKKIRFIANASMDGSLVLYPKDDLTHPIELQAVYKNGMYIVDVAYVPDGCYSQAVFVLSDGKQERSVCVAKYLTLDGSGASWDG